MDSIRRSPTDVMPRDLHEELAAGMPIVLVDVREPVEWAVARLPDARLLPLDQLADGVDALDRDADIVVYCHHGVRSGAAAHWLRSLGFARVRNLIGGIDRWSVEVDSTVPRY